MKSEFECRDTRTGELRQLKTKEDFDWFINTKNERNREARLKGVS